MICLSENISEFLSLSVQFSACMNISKFYILNINSETENIAFHNIFTGSILMFKKGIE